MAWIREFGTGQLSSRVAVLVLGTADWNQPIATNQHYAVRELARSCDVTFVESTGLRRPELSRRDIVRILRRVRRMMRTVPPNSTQDVRVVPPHVTVVSPIVIPWHVRPFTWINRRLMKRLVRPWASSGPRRVLWTYTPVTFGLEQSVPTVYHCVDLLGAQAGISEKVVASGEATLARAGAVAGASSEVVARHLREVGFRRIEEWPNVADLEVFTASAASAGRCPRAVFAGNLTESKVDFKLLAMVLDAGIDLHLAGPISEGGGDAQRAVRELKRAGAIYHGMLAPQELADLLRSSTVGLIPYVINDYTQGVNPLKTFEYLAAGLGVVSTRVPAVEADSEDVFVCDARKPFVDAVKELSGQPELEVLERRIAKAEPHGWLERGRFIRAMVDELAAPE